MKKIFPKIDWWQQLMDIMIISSIPDHLFRVSLRRILR